jgi:hypothetical protein
MNLSSLSVQPFVLNLFTYAARHAGSLATFKAHRVK